jgi:hypothetical protein
MSLQILAIYAGIFALSGFKYVPGIFATFYPGSPFSFWDRVLCTSSGFMTGVLLYAYAGTWLANQYRKWTGKPTAETQNRKPSERMTRLWNRYGLIGVAFLTPPVISPPIGVGIALAFGARRADIVKYMGLSILLWAPVFATSGEFIRDLLAKWL